MGHARSFKHAGASALAGLALLMTGGLASASKGSGAPVRGALTLDRQHAMVGKTINARLEIRAFSDAPQLRLKIVALDNCAAQTSPTTPALVEHVKKGSVIHVAATFRVTHATPCVLVAEVVSHEGANYRFASVFGATLNPGPPKADNARPGTTGDGRPSADFTYSNALTAEALAKAPQRGQALLALRPDAPRCKTPTAKPPKLGVDIDHDAPTVILADFNGDGWCDYALGVPYPVNSSMNAYDLSQLMVLGQAGGWKRVFNGKKSHQFMDEGYPPDTWPTFRIDLTDIRLVFPAKQGAPFVLGLMAGRADEGKRDLGNGCHQYRSVHRWDDALATFKKTEEATRDAVLSYFYSVLEQPCNARK